MPHVIRLRGPWQFQIIDGGRVGQPTAGKVQTPIDWPQTLYDGFCGRVKCTRNFGMPTGLDKDSVVMLVFGQADLLGQISLNGELISSPRQSETLTRFDITDQLKPRNELCIEFELPSPGPNCNVQLELSTRK